MTLKMHADEVDIDASLVRRLLAAQFPQWADLRIEPVASGGRTTRSTGSATTWSSGCPRTERTTEALEKEYRWLPRLAPLLPLAIPVPLAMGTPAEGYPWQWSDLPLARRRDRDDRAHRRSARSGDRPGRVRRRLAADRPHGRPAARAGTTSAAASRWSTRDAATRSAIASLRHDDRCRRGDSGVGSSPSRAGVAGPARLDPRRPRRAEPAGRERDGSAPSSTSAVSAWAIRPAT